MTNAYIITTNNLCKNYGVGDNAVRALKNCNIKIHTGESVRERLSVSSDRPAQEKVHS